MGFEKMKKGSKRKCKICGKPFYVDRGYANGAHDRGRQTCSDECTHKLIKQSQIGKPKSWMHDPVRLEKAKPKWRAHQKRLYAEGRVRLVEPEIRAKAIANSCEEAKTNPLRGKFETNCHAEDWHLIDPQGREWSFRNLRHFIREHRELFSARLLEPVGKYEARCEPCLHKLSPRAAQRSMTSCGGWRWNPKYEGVK